ncbi:hypothetical protein N2152v2_008333 [Parachlorella kessleri]
MEDEVEKFHKRKDKLSLNVSDDELDEDSLDEEAVYDISDEEEEDSDEEEERDTRLGKLTKTAKALGAKLRIAQGEGEDDDEGDEEEARLREKLWGKKKRAYYDADNIDLEGSDDEEALKEEEEEALRLQREAAEGLRAEDFGVEEGGDGEEEEGSSEEEGAGGEEPTLGAAAALAGNGMEVERVGKEVGALSAEERAAAALRDAPELLALLGELRGCLAEVRSRVGPLLKEVREGQLATAEGVSYLEAKHLLLLHYCTSIVFYLLLKAEGRPIRDHPVIARLVEIRAYLEKIRPIDKKLHYQVEKLLAAAQAAGTAGAQAAPAAEGGAAAAAAEDPLRYGPRPDALVAKVQLPEEGGAAGDAGGVYRPPRLNPVSMEDVDVEEGRRYAREQRQQRQAARKAARSELVQELARELAGAPEEQRLGAVAGMDTAEAIRARHRLQERDEVEEELMVRVPLSRDERKRLKAQRREGLAGRALLDDFADDIADLAGEGGADELGGGFGRHRLSQKFGVDLAAAAAAKKGRSGDADLPQREALHERRAKFDSVRAKHGLQAGPFSDDLDDGNDDLALGGGGGKRRRQQQQGGAGGAAVDDEVYTAAREAAAAKKQKRKEAYKYPETLPPVADPTTTDARKITRDIEKNRGLTPHRRKDIKNPRKKNRMKFAKASVARKGQVQEVRAGGGGGYGGEQTGIKARVSKSVRF